MSKKQNILEMPVGEAVAIRKQQAIEAIDKLRAQVEACDPLTADWGDFGDVSHVWNNVTELIY